MAKYIWRSAKEVLGTSWRGDNKINRAWWWNKEVKEKVKEERKAYAAFMNSKTDEVKEISRVGYVAAIKVAKKAVVLAKSTTYDRWYQKLDTKEGEEEVFKLQRVGERRTGDLGVLRCIEDENDRVLFEDAKIKQRWQMYFSELLNCKMMEDFWSRERESSEGQLDPRFCEPISEDEIKESLRKMTNRKVEGPDQIPVKV